MTDQTEPRPGPLDAEGATYEAAVAVVMAARKPSPSYVQRTLRVTYEQARSWIERMEADGICGPANSAGLRAMIATPTPPTEPSVRAGEVEPVAWRMRQLHWKIDGPITGWMLCDRLPTPSDRHRWEIEPLYATPVAQAPAETGGAEPVDRYAIKGAIARAMQDERDGKPCGCIVEAGCDARGYHDPEYAASGFLDEAAENVLTLYATPVAQAPAVNGEGGR